MKNLQKTLKNQKQMKKTALAIIGVILLTSCFKTPKENTYKCQEGYEGVDCDIEIREKMVGIWSAQDTSYGVPTPYYARIAKGSPVTQLYLWDFSNTYNTLIKATMTGGIITIPTQKLSDTTLIVGKGVYDNQNLKISWQYILYSENSTSVFTGEWVKK